MQYKKQGERLKRKRLEKNLTQVQLASFLGISRQAYSKYECGLSSPSLNNILKLSYILKTNLVELYLNKKNIFPNDLPIKRFITKKSSALHLETSEVEYNQFYMLIKFFSFLSDAERMEVFDFLQGMINRKEE